MDDTNPAREKRARENFPRKVLRHLGWAVRDRFPTRWVEREVSGVRMAMPWSHRLPDFAERDAAYGENLLQLAEHLGRGRRLDVLDVGANIGDSTLLILHRTDARVLAVEPDEVFLPFLRHNCGSDARVVIEPSILTADETTEGYTATRIGGTATYAKDAAGAAVPTISVEQLRRGHPEFDGLRLVKSDTDGYDVLLVPAIAKVWAEASPVLFFEYDHRASVAAGNDPLQVWEELAELGYTECAVWDNGGHPLRRGTLEEVRELARSTEPSSPRLFWDVAAAHAADTEGIAVLDELVPR